jgi:hypothetical protein
MDTEFRVGGLDYTLKRTEVWAKWNVSTIKF